MNAVLKSKLREYAKSLRALVEAGSDEETLRHEIEQQMESVFRIVGVCLGVPSETFVWEYYDKGKAYNSIGPITPLEFYEKHVKPYYNVDDKVRLIVCYQNHT